MIFGTASLELSLLLVADICCLVLCAGRGRSAWTYAPKSRSSAQAIANIETAVEQGYAYDALICKHMQAVEKQLSFPEIAALMELNS